MKKFTLIFLLLLISMAAFAASPSWSAFDTNTLTINQLVPAPSGSIAVNTNVVATRAWVESQGGGGGGSNNILSNAYTTNTQANADAYSTNNVADYKGAAHDSTNALGSAAFVSTNNFLNPNQGVVTNVTVEQFGAVGDAQEFTNATFISSSGAVSVSGASFDSSYIGKSAVMYGDATNITYSFGKITAVGSSTSITVNSNALASFTGNGVLVVGTDNQNAYSNFLAWAVVQKLNVTANCFGNYLFTGTPQLNVLASVVTNYGVVVIPTNNSAIGQSVVFQGLVSPATQLNTEKRQVFRGSTFYVASHSANTNYANALFLDANQNSLEYIKFHNVAFESPVNPPIGIYYDRYGNPADFYTCIFSTDWPNGFSGATGVNPIFFNQSYEQNSNVVEAVVAPAYLNAGSITIQNSAFVNWPVGFDMGGHSKSYDNNFTLCGSAIVIDNELDAALDVVDMYSFCNANTFAAAYNYSPSLMQVNLDSIKIEAHGFGDNVFYDPRKECVGKFSHFGDSILFTNAAMHEEKIVGSDAYIYAFYVGSDFFFGNGASITNTSFSSLAANDPVEGTLWSVPTGTTLRGTISPTTGNGSGLTNVFGASVSSANSSVTVTKTKNATTGVTNYDLSVPTGGNVFSNTPTQFQNLIVTNNGVATVITSNAVTTATLSAPVINNLSLIVITNVGLGTYMSFSASANQFTIASSPNTVRFSPTAFSMGSSATIEVDSPGVVNGRMQLDASGNFGIGYSTTIPGTFNFYKGGNGNIVVTNNGVATTITSNTVTTLTNNASWFSGNGGGLTNITQTFVFTNAGTTNWPWTVQCPGAKSFTVLCIGGGGGGGSGAREATTSIRGGGGSGASSGRSLSAPIPTAGLSSTIAIVVGAGGAGGAAVTTDSTVGNSGGNGTASSFGSLWRSLGGGTSGGAGAGGGTATAGGTAGNAGMNGFTASGVTGVVGSTGSGATGQPAPAISSASAGGGAGQIAVTTTTTTGGTGGASPLFYAGTLAGGAGGTGTGGVAPGQGNEDDNMFIVTGAGGGGYRTGVAGQAGGNALNYGGSGGGGSPSDNGFASGAGGNGAAGAVIVTVYF